MRRTIRNTRIRTKLDTAGDKELSKRWGKNWHSEPISDKYSKNLCNRKERRRARIRR